MEFQFEWDEEKADRNYRKHKVTFEEAESAFWDPLLVTAYDEEHSDEEDRYISIGLSIEGRLLTVIHTERGEIIRIISCWKSTVTEREPYESNAF